MTTRPPDADLFRVLERYPRSCHPDAIEYVGAAGGFSGACFWRLATPQGWLCVRRWPEGHPVPGHLRQIHEVLDLVAREGLHVVPVPLRTIDGHTFVRSTDRLWEVTPWLPGEANYASRPSEKKLADAAQTLARFHLAAMHSPLAHPAGGPSPGLRLRHAHLERLRQGESQAIRRAVSVTTWPGLKPRAVTLLDLFDAVAPRRMAAVEAACRARVPLQPCIRDIWHDHVLFEGSRVSGIVDFGAMQVESVVGDVTRLFGSLVEDDSDLWRFALHAYETVRPLSTAERWLIAAFDHTSTLLSGMNWLRWIFLERRDFEGRERILARLDVTIRRLQRLC